MRTPPAAGHPLLAVAVDEPFCESSLSRRFSVKRREPLTSGTRTLYSWEAWSR